ncbi:MAG: hypothetical protein L0I24_00345 [Pseudonocardia sp.]|nr:hypothetical protein [Pseudonocardia sp.]
MNRETARITAALCCLLAPFALAACWSVGYALDAPPAGYQRPALVQAAPVPPVPRHAAAVDDEVAAPVTVVRAVEQEPATTPPSVPSTVPTPPAVEEEVVLAEQEVVTEDLVEQEVVVDQGDDTELPTDTGTAPSPGPDPGSLPPVCPGPDVRCYGPNQP